jgi:hypothetical protein
MENKTNPNDSEFFVPMAKVKDFIKDDFLSTSFSQQIASNFIKLKEDLLKKIVRMALGKEDFELTEVKRFSFIRFEHLSQREFIGLDDDVIGEVVMFQKEENFQWKAGFEFQPGEMVMRNGVLDFVPKLEKE